MLIKKPSDIPSSEITPEGVYLNRRAFIQRAGQLGLVAAVGGLVTPALACASPDANAQQQEPADKPNTLEMLTTYNNYYEFGTLKDEPAQYAHTLKTKPWSIAVEGLVAKPAVYQLEDFLAPHKLEDRIYRHRCVEAWSMVFPWQGIPLAEFIKRVQPTASAKYIEFTTLWDPKQMPEAAGLSGLWPYTEGLRLDEAMHPLAFLATGIYGKPIPNQNGAPIRLVVPWKYGFKGGKSIVKIRFTEVQPRTTWNRAAANEYGFYANVNPTVDHPRWSQAREQRLPSFFKNTPTKLFNGYMEVASLYSGMDLRKNY